MRVSIISVFVCFTFYNKKQKKYENQSKNYTIFTSTHHHTHLNVLYSLHRSYERYPTKPPPFTPIQTIAIHRIDSPLRINLYYFWIILSTIHSYDLQLIPVTIHSFTNNFIHLPTSTHPPFHI